MSFKFIVQELIDDSESKALSRLTVEKPNEELGRNLLTIDDARRWLLHPSNWIESRTFILKWDGLLPKISREHAERLLREPWDTGIFWAACNEQRELKIGRRRIEVQQEPQE